MEHDTASVPVPAADGSRDGDRRQQERRAETRRNLARVSARALIAILVAAGAVLIAAATWLQFRAMNARVEALEVTQQRQAAERERLQGELESLRNSTTATAARVEELAALPTQFAELRGTVEELRARADGGQRAWMLAEARYLLEIANRRLTLERDAGTALAALLTADERLRAVGDPGLTPVRRALASEIQAVRVLPQPDLPGLAARLAAAEELSAELKVLGEVPTRFVATSEARESSTGLARAWHTLKSSIGGIISVRRIGKDAVELVSLEEQGVRRHHLQLLLFAARVAALRGDEAGFHASIGNARHWLARMFDARDPRVQHLSQQLGEIDNIRIAPPLPDISGSLQLLQRLEKSSAPPRRQPS